ncbi:MAG: autotransporter-associated beta strand repeat-containing protein [Opitutales bacterium]|nr:autotransporter-associated beta strand repeat-containing protein [Opitutales bacterium]
MKNLARSFLLAAAATVSLSAQNVITGPSSSQTSYLTPTSPGWSATALLTVGDAINGYQMAGIPDGLGAYSNGNGTMTVLANHEIGSIQGTTTLLGTTRAHGAAGGFVSKWVINTSTWQVISGGDFVTSRLDQMMWNATTSTWAAPAAAYAYLRPCSADLPNLAAFYDASNGGTGYNGRIFLNGEETGAEGKAFAWIVDGAEAGKVYELPHHGKYSYENLLARSNYGVSPGAANLLQTVVVGTDDTTPGEVYVYIGAKTNLGNAVQKAGLTNGNTYGIKVTSATGYTGAVTLENATGITGAFTLHQIFTNATIGAKTGVEFQAESTRLGVTQFARPEDAHWLDHDSLILATTGASGTAMNNVTVSAKIYQFDFNSDATNGILTTGGNIKLLVNSSNLTGKDGAKAASFDNLTIGDDGLLYIQEDPGNNAYVAKHWVVNPLAGSQSQIEASAVQIFESDRSRFTTGATQYQTLDEEHSGIIDITSIVADGINGSKWFLVATQNHAAATGASAATLVEGGQFIALNFKNPNSSLNGNLLTLDNGGTILASGTAISYNVALTGTGGVFNTTANTSVSGAIGGTGGLWKNGSGTLTLTGVNSYTGNTNVEAGKLVVNGSLASAVRILKGGSLGGNASIVGNLTNLGTLAPGNSPGTVNVTGNYIEAGTLDIEVWGLTANTQHDQVIVSGTATFQAGSTIKATKTGGAFDLARTESVLAVTAAAYSGSFTNLDRGTQATQVFFNNATGRIHGSGLTETQTFADLTVDTNRKAIATALYADGLTNAQVIKNGTAALATSKAFIATGEMGAATVAFLGAANVDTALDALSPEPYGTTMLMASRNSLSLARAIVGATAANEGWNVQLGYSQEQSTSTASLTTLNGSFDVNARYAVLSHQAGADSVFSVLVSDNSGQSSASGFASEASGRSYGLGFGTNIALGRLDVGVVIGELNANGTRSGQSFANQKINSTSLNARLSFTKLGAFTPYVGISRNIGSSDAFLETGTGANLSVAAAKQSDVTAEIGMGYGIQLGDVVTVSLNIAYEHALSNEGGALNAGFADATVPTSFTVQTSGAGQDLLRAGLGFNLALGEGRAVTLGYDYHSGADIKSAHQIKAGYSFRF